MPDDLQGLNIKVPKELNSRIDDAVLVERIRTMRRITRKQVVIDLLKSGLERLEANPDYQRLLKGEDI